ncbi:MAG: lipocalin family protein [Steroidobacteraceae bacterium]
MRQYGQLMARTPQISAAEYRRMLAQIKTMGYDLSKVRKSPQRWPEARVSSQSFRDSCRGEPGALGEGNSGAQRGRNHLPWQVGDAHH